MSHEITLFPDFLMPIEAAAVILLILASIFAAAYLALCRELRHKAERADGLAIDRAKGWYAATQAQYDADVIRLERDALASQVERLTSALAMAESAKRIEHDLRVWHAAEAESLRKRLVDRERDEAGIVMN